MAPTRAGRVKISALTVQCRVHENYVEVCTVQPIHQCVRIRVEKVSSPCQSGKSIRGVDGPRVALAGSGAEDEVAHGAAAPKEKWREQQPLRKRGNAGRIGARLVTTCHAGTLTFGSIGEQASIYDDEVLSTGSCAAPWRGPDVRPWKDACTDLGHSEESNTQSAAEQIHKSRVAIHHVRVKDVWQSGADDPRECAAGVSTTKLAILVGAFDVDGDVGVDVQERTPLVAISASYDAGSAPWACHVRQVILHITSGSPISERYVGREKRVSDRTTIRRQEEGDSLLSELYESQCLRAPTRQCLPRHVAWAAARVATLDLAMSLELLLQEKQD